MRIQRASGWYDCDEALGEPVGFLRASGGWSVSNEIHRESVLIDCGLTVRRAYVARIEGGKYTETVKSYTFTNGTFMTPDQFAAWRESAEPVYAQNVAQWRRGQEAQEKARAEAYALQQQRDKVNREIEQAQANLARLEQERAQIGA